jgi:uncharacterized circularly permuted ATP-grasp superfamily protein/uncharacterized alpha-E superfamily protein
MQTVEDSSTLKQGQARSILDEYAPPQGAYDEVLDPFGATRPSWLAAANRLRELGCEDFNKRAQQLRRIVQENGITYNAYGDSEGARRPWVMDPLPMIVDYAEWSAIEKGIAQRVRLINSILADIYGPQNLLHTGRLPASLVYGNPNFLRPCHGFRPTNGVYVHIYAADLARDDAGNWRVLADRVDVPSGIGYAVENRFITQQVMPDIFRAAGPVRLKPFFGRMLESFETLVRRRTEQPCIVMLSPGRSFETFFEQAFFARNLGYPLVEGADLTTRDNCVYMKTVGGLKQVDVIIRNVPSPDCDPLEMDSTSTLGVPGLVEAARAGNVAIANSLGAGVMESPAMPAFYGNLCKNLLGEDLKIPSAETLWCGEPNALSHVLANLGGMVIKPVFRSRSSEAVFGQTLNAGELAKLRDLVAAAPSSYCAQQMVSRGTLPAIGPNGRVEPRHFIMRVFLVANKDGYEMMPGGLTRITQGLGGCSVSMADGGSSKDTWMIAPPDMPQQDHPLPHTGPVRIRRSTAELTSREADNLFWMGRYMERTDYLTRLLRMLATEMHEGSGACMPQHLMPFMNTALGIAPGGKGSVSATRMELPKAEIKLGEIIWNRALPAGLCSSIQCLHGTSSSVKERLSLDAVSILNQLAGYATQTPPSPDGKAPARRLNSIGMLLAGVSGSMAENMTRAADWRFLDMGRRIERALNISDLLQQVFSQPNPVSAAMLASLLVCADSRYTYASRYLTNMQPEAVADLLLLDATNPRSIAFQTGIIAEHVVNLPVSAAEEPQTKRRKLALGIDSAIRLADVRELFAAGGEAKYAALNALLARLSEDLLLLSDEIALHYFSHSDKKSLFSRSY